MADPDVSELAAALRLALGQLVRRLRAESQVPLGQLAVLGLLDRDGASTTSQLAANQIVRHQSMARTVAQLVALGHVSQQPDPTDRRQTLLSITPAGRTRIQSERERRVDWLADSIGHELTTEEQRTLSDAANLLARLAHR